MRRIAQHSILLTVVLLTVVLLTVVLLTVSSCEVGKKVGGGFPYCIWDIETKICSDF